MDGTKTIKKFTLANDAANALRSYINTFDDTDMENSNSANLITALNHLDEITLDNVQKERLKVQYEETGAAYQSLIRVISRDTGDTPEDNDILVRAAGVLEIRYQELHKSLSQIQTVEEE